MGKNVLVTAHPFPLWTLPRRGNRYLNSKKLFLILDLSHGSFCCLSSDCTQLTSVTAGKPAHCAAAIHAVQLVRFLLQLDANHGNFTYMRIFFI